MTDGRATYTRACLARAGRLIRSGWLAAAILLSFIAPLPAAAVEQLHIVSRWPGNLPEHWYWDGTQVQNWKVIGGKTIVSPPAVVSYNGKVHVFAVSDDQKLYQAIWDGTNWVGWFDFGGPFDAVGAAAVDYFGFLLLVAVLPDHRFVLAYFDPNSNQWNGFFDFGTGVFGRPAAVVNQGQLHFFVRGGNDNYFQYYFDGQQWNGFFDIGGPFAAGPAAVSYHDQIHILGPSFSGKLFEGFFAGTQLNGFFDRGAPPGTTVDGPAAAAVIAQDFLVALVRGANNGIFANVFQFGAWSGYSGSLGQALSGPGVATHVVGGGGGGGGNRKPTLGSVVATRIVHAFGRDDAPRAEGLKGRPGVNALEPLLAPAIITLDANQDGKYDALDPIVAAAASLASCCTLLVAEGGADPDGNPIVFKWQATTGTFYSTGSDGSGGFAFGAKITDITKYTRNSVFWEAPSIGFPIVFWNLMGGATNVGVHVEDVPASGPPLSSDTKFAALEWGRTIHLEVGLASSRRLPGNDPMYPNGFELSFLATIFGNSANPGSLPVTIRFECGGKDLLVVDQILTPGVPFKCPYHDDEENHQVTITAVATVGGAFISPPMGPGLDRWKSRGCTIGSTDTDLVKGPGVCNDQQVPGGDTPDSRFIDLGRTQATFTFDYQTFSQKDRMIVSYQGQPLFDTGCVGASGSKQISYSGSASGVTVQVIPNCEGGSGTSWNYTVHCPAQ